MWYHVDNGEKKKRKKTVYLFVFSQNKFSNKRVISLNSVGKIVQNIDKALNSYFKKSSWKFMCL